MHSLAHSTLPSAPVLHGCVRCCRVVCCCCCACSLTRASGCGGPLDHDPTNLVVRLHFRYSVEYLIETGLLSPQGSPRRTPPSSLHDRPLPLFPVIAHLLTSVTRALSRSSASSATRLQWARGAPVLDRADQLPVPHPAHQGRVQAHCDPIANCKAGRQLVG